jgi:hypothetical protein
MTLLLAFLFGLACASATGPMAPNPPPIDLVVVFTPVGDGSAYAARLGGQTYSTGGAFRVSLAAGTHRITGTFRGAGLGVGFQTLGSAGGVQSETVQSLAGPSPRTAACSVAYTDPDTSRVDRGFEVQFQVATAAATCPGPPP